MRILYIGSNPLDENTLLLEREITSLQTKFLNSSSSGVSFTFLPGLPVEKLPREISRIKPDILHISAHGIAEGLLLANQNGEPKKLTPEALSIFVSIEHPPKLIILNACNSDVMAKQLTEVVPITLGITAEISNAAARESVRLFYERIFDGHSVNDAFKACREMIRTIDDGSSSAELCRNPIVKPENELFLVSPRIIARFEDDSYRASDGDFEFGLGVIGCPGNTHQVVFFTDDEDLADEDNLEESLCSVARGTPIRGVIWVDHSWFVSGNIRIFASGVTADGEQFATSSMLTDALTYFYRVQAKNPNVTLPAAMKKAVRTLVSFDGSELDEVIAATRSSARNAKKGQMRKAKKKKK